MQRAKKKEILFVQKNKSAPAIVFFFNSQDLFPLILHFYAEIMN